MYAYMFCQSCFINFEIPSILANYNYNFFYGDDGTGSRFLSISVESILDICMEYFVIVFACRIAYLLCGGSIRAGDLAGPRRRGACSQAVMFVFGREKWRVTGTDAGGYSTSIYIYILL